MGTVAKGSEVSRVHAAAVLLVCFGCAQTPLQAPRAPTHGGDTLGVLSYNLNYGIAGDAATLEAIAAQPSELVLLQETTPDWEQSLRTRFAGAFPYMAFRHCCGAGGLGVLSKYPVQDVEYIEPPEGGWFPGWRLSVQSPLGDVQVLNVHLRPQLGDSGASVGGVLSGMVTTPPIRKEQIQLYASHLQAGVPTLIAGDFNESEHGSAVSWLEAHGLHSALPDFSRDDTWNWNTSLGRVSRRFDHIVTSRELRALSARVIDAGSSDHRPVFALVERVARNPEQKP
jgi:endonuclease/exonuclease/phosphatase family metal-dependent hydrolase